MSEETLLRDAMQIVAQGWCRATSASKEMDAELAVDIAHAILPIVRKARAWDVLARENRGSLGNARVVLFIDEGAHSYWMDRRIDPTTLLEAVLKMGERCDGNHGGPPCADPECWAREEEKR